MLDAIRRRARSRPALDAPQARCVHVWRFDLTQADDGASLDAGERARAARFVRADDRRRFTAAHASMRSVLGAYLGVAPRLVDIVTDPLGKPVLAGMGVLHFNLSHSMDMALLAVSTAMPVGVDIESVRPDLGEQELARGVLSGAEFDAFSRMASAQRAQALVGCWTRKEALLKALGCGLRLDPGQVEVGLSTVERKLVRVAPGSMPVEIAQLPAPQGYCAAVATVGSMAEITMHAADDLRQRMR